MTFWKTQNYRDDGEQINDCIGLKVGEVFDYKGGAWGYFGEVIELFCTLFVVIVIWLYEFMRILRTEHYKMNFTV